MTRLGDRQILMRDIAQARAKGSRLAPACALAGLDPHTLQRWKTGDDGDRRPDADRPVSSRALSEAEQAQIIAVANEPRFAETPPAQIVPALADEGVYIASESQAGRSRIASHSNGTPGCFPNRSATCDGVAGTTTQGGTNDQTLRHG
jgi:putative transposase